MGLYFAQCWFGEGINVSQISSMPMRGGGICVPWVSLVGITCVTGSFLGIQTQVRTDPAFYRQRFWQFSVSWDCVKRALFHSAWQKKCLFNKKKRKRKGEKNHTARKRNLISSFSGDRAAAHVTANALYF